MLAGALPVAVSRGSSEALILLPKAGTRPDSRLLDLPSRAPLPQTQLCSLPCTRCPRDEPAFLPGEYRCAQVLCPPLKGTRPIRTLQPDGLGAKPQPINQNSSPFALETISRPIQLGSLRISHHLFPAKAAGSWRAEQLSYSKRPHCYMRVTSWCWWVNLGGWMLIYNVPVIRTQ